MVVRTRSRVSGFCTDLALLYQFCSIYDLFEVPGNDS